MAAGGPFPPQKGDPPLFHKGGVNPSLPRRLDTFLLRKEVDESGPLAFLVHKKWLF